jgi:hypothetical protein
MMEELERSHIDRNSPIWGGSDCDYFSLEAEVNSYWTQYYKIKLNLTDELLYQTPTEKEEIEEHNRLIQALEDGVFDNTELKTEEYFRELWRDVSKVGFDLENSDHCIDTCNTLIREEVEWWDERTDLRRYQALKVPGLLEYHSWDVIWRLCKYHKLVAHPLHNYASKRQSVLKKDLPKNKSNKSISLNLQTMQFAKLCEGFKRIGALDKATSLSVFKSYLNGSEIGSVVTPIKFKNTTHVAVFIYLCEEYRLQAGKDYYKWAEFFNISKTYANKQTSAYRTGELSFPPYYHQMESILKEIGCSMPDYKKR